MTGRTVKKSAERGKWRQDGPGGTDGAVCSWRNRGLGARTWPVPQDQGIFRLLFEETFLFAQVRIICAGVGSVIK